MSSKPLARKAGRPIVRSGAAPHCSPVDHRLVLCRTLDALPGLRRGIPPRWGIVRSLALGQRVAVWSARAGQTTRDISVRVSQTSTNVIECASIADDLLSLSTLCLHLHYGASTMRHYSNSHMPQGHTLQQPLIQSIAVAQEDKRHPFSSLVAKLSGHSPIRASCHGCDICPAAAFAVVRMHM